MYSVFLGRLVSFVFCFHAQQPVPLPEGKQRRTPPLICREVGDRSIFTASRHERQPTLTKNMEPLLVDHIIVSCLWGCRGTRDLRCLRSLRHLPSRLHLPCGRSLGVVRGWLGIGLEASVTRWKGHQYEGGRSTKGAGYVERKNYVFFALDYAQPDPPTVAVLSSPPAGLGRPAF